MFPYLQDQNYADTTTIIHTRYSISKIVGIKSKDKNPM